MSDDSCQHHCHTEIMLDFTVHWVVQYSVSNKLVRLIVLEVLYHFMKMKEVLNTYIRCILPNIARGTKAVIIMLNDHRLIINMILYHQAGL